MPDAEGHVQRGDWPEAPDSADYHTPSDWGWDFYGFTVADLPPQPFPFAEPEAYADRAKFGPPGTLWIFDVGDLFTRLTHLDSTLTKLVLNRALRKLGTRIWGGGIEAWAVPYPPGEENPMSINVVRCVIHGKLGLAEEVAHVLHFRTQPDADVPQTADQLKTLGGQLATIWEAFLNKGVTPYGQGASVRTYMPRTLVYDELRLAYLQVAPGVKPVYLVPTQYVAAGANSKGDGQAATLPYEVAMALSLGTALRGPRHRGRIYLGPFTSGVMAGVNLSGGTNTPAAAAADGLFSGVQNEIAHAFGADFVDPVRLTTGVRLNVLSQKFGESYAVTGVRAGAVPDSQRRRRRAQLESYQQSWGLAPGVPES